MISIVIPAHNEEELLPKCLDHIEQSGKNLESEVEVIVVINRCTDKTEEIAINRGCKIVQNDQKNLAAIRNSGIKAAQGEIIVTIDADSFMSENMLTKILQTMQTERYIGGGVLILPERWSLGIFCSLLALFPFFLIWGISAGVFFGRKQDFLAIGGFNENLFSAEDVDFAKRFKKYGKSKKLRFKNLFSTYIITSCRKFDRFGDWYALKHPKMTLKLLKGEKSKDADRIWYDFNT